MNKNLLLGLGVVLALVLGGFAAFRPAKVIETKTINEKLGSVTGPSFPFPYLDLNGSLLFPAGSRFAGYTGANLNGGVVAGTSTVCSFMSPANGTSTIIRASMNVQARTLAGTAGILGMITGINGTSGTNQPGGGDNDIRNGTGTVIAQNGLAFDAGGVDGGYSLTATNTPNLLTGTQVSSSTPVKFILENTSSATGTCTVWFGQP